MVIWEPKERILTILVLFVLAVFFSIKKQEIWSKKRIFKIPLYVAICTNKSNRKIKIKMYTCLILCRNPLLLYVSGGTFDVPWPGAGVGKAPMGQALVVTAELFFLS